MSKFHMTDSAEEMDVAVIGLSGRLPGASSYAAFWQNLCAGVESISFFSEDELASTVNATLRENPNYVNAGGVLPDIELFDAFFFGYSPNEAATMDPQHRLFLECAWESLEDAGYDPETYPGLIGVYAGAGMNTYLYNNLRPNRAPLEPGGDYHLMIASDKDFLATKVCYKLNLKGPGVSIQTACSTSLVATHLACQSLRNGECDMALAGGVSIRVPHRAGYVYREGMILSPDGHCRAFDARAGGTVIGNGVGIVVLKMLADALADGDRILAVIKGSTINNDGSLKAGYTAPALDAQAAVISEALGIAGVAPESVTYVEAHGTGTAIGDPIEVAALTKAFRRSTDEKGFCALGSVKTNIGHLDAAAGVAGLIKAVLMLEHRRIPPSLHFQEPNPRIDLANSPFYVNAKLADWDTDRLPRRAGVSSFGIGGTNAHAVLEEAPIVEPSAEAGPWQLLALSARTPLALDAATANLVKHLEQHPHINLADVAYTLQVGRREFGHRRFVVCQNPKDATSALSDLDPRRVFTRFEEATERPVVFMFTGQGAQYVNMAQELYQVEPTFREEVDRCSELLRPHLGLDLRDLLYPAAEQAQEAARQLGQTAITQPALFVIEYALARLWMAWGVHPAAMIGHSIGEYVAACLAGVFSLQDALALIAARGRLMQQLPPGAMLAVPLTEREIRPLLEGKLSLAVINGPALCVVSGRTEDVDALYSRLAAQGVACRRLQTSHAFHSTMMEPILQPFVAEVSKIERQSPQIPYVSNVSGTWVTTAEATDADYWARHLCQTVRFADGLQQLVADPDQILLEVGPGRTLSTLATQHPGRATRQVVLSSVRHPQDRQSDVAFLLTTLGKLWLSGAKVDWPGFHANERRLRLSLPTYPFERQRYWIEPSGGVDSGLPAAGQQPGKQGAARKQDVAEWFYVPSWIRSVAPTRKASEQLSRSCWLVFADAWGLGSRLAERLGRDGQDVTVVQVGPAFARLDDGSYVLDPGQKEGYDSLLADLSERGIKPRTIVHSWTATPSGAAAPDAETLAGSQDLGFHSLLFLAQALGKQNFTDDLELAVLSTGLLEVTGEEALCPEKATLLGPVRVLGHEYPNIHCRSIDVVLPPPGTGADRKLVDLLLAEITAKSADSIVAYRGNHRWKQTFEPVRLEPPGQPAPRLRAGGVYLITGGLGGMGLTLAKALAEEVQAGLILIGRSEFPAAGEWDRWLSMHGLDDVISHKIQQLRQIEELGGEVLIIQADVANREQMQAAIGQAVAHFGQIHGIIHTAGVPGGGLIQLKTREDAESVLSPKVQGTLILQDLLQDVPLDFAILCSSHNSIIGRAGQVDYAAANAFLDAFVYHNRLDSAFTTCINWDTWRRVGMAAKAAEQWAADRRPGQPQSGIGGHPLLDRCIVQSETEEAYVTRFRVSEHWVLHEHGIMGRPTLPGTTYLEMVRAAFAGRAGSSVLEIRDVYFLTPLILQEDEEREVRTILKNQGDLVSFSILSQAGPGGEAWQEHARGTIAALDMAPSRPWAIGEIESRCAQESVMYPLQKARLGGFDLKQQTIRRGSGPQGKPLAVSSLVVTEASAKAEGQSMEFGPRWNNLKWVKLGTEEGLALLELPEEFGADLQSFKLHPALLDMATSFLRLFKSQGSYLPLSYKKIRINGPLPGRIYSYARFAEHGPAQEATQSFDVAILDEQGTPLVEIEEFTAIRVQDTGKLGAPSGLRFVPLALSMGDPGLLAEPAISASLKRDLAEGLLPTEAVDVFGRILASSLPQVVVSTRDFLARIKEGQALQTPPLFQVGEKATSSRPKHPRPDLMTAYAPPRNETEQKLAEIWQDVLGIAQVGVHDSFFDLGGDSLLVAQVHSQFRARFDNDVSIATLLQYPTIADLAQFLGERAESDQPTFDQVHDRATKQKEALKRRKEKMMKKRSR